MDNNIFEVAHACLYEVCDLLNIDYVYDDKKNKELYDFLTKPSKKYDNIIKSYPFLKHEYDVGSIKRILQLIVISRAYIKTFYNMENEIDIDESQLVSESLSGKTYQEVLELFIDYEDMALSIIDLFFDFSFSLFVETSMAKEMVFKKGMLQEILDMNPFEVLDVYDYIPSNKFTDTELLIQKLFNYYNRALGEYYPDSDDPENTLINIFLNYLKDEDDSVLIYIISNVYENICTSHGELTPMNKALKKYIEGNNNITIINRMYSDKKFAKTIIDLFIGFNDYLTDQELYKRREEFNKKGDIVILRRLNPFYDSEEIVYNAMKRSREK